MMQERGSLPFGPFRTIAVRATALFALVAITVPWRGRAMRRARRIQSTDQSTAHSTLQPLALLLTILGGLLLRVALWGDFALREDEAIYAYWALHWRTVDPMLLTVWPDKPPLFLWSLAGVMALLGDSQAGARWLNIAVSTLTIPVVALGARRLWRSPTAGVAAALLMALNPMAISFAPTVYTDPMLVLFGALMVTAALGKRFGWAGAALAAACMTKQQGLLYVPLLFGLWCVTARNWRTFGRALVGVVLVAAPFLLWDSLRWAVAPSPWDLAQRTYAPLTLAAPATWPARAQAWARLLWYLCSSTPVWLLLGLAALVALILPPRGRHGLTTPVRRIFQEVQKLPGRLKTQRSRQVLVLLAWGVGFIALHLFTTVQAWDRYLLPLVPLLVWLCAGPFVALVERTLSLAQRLPSLPLRRGLQALTLLALLSLAPGAVAAAGGDLPIGSDHGDYAGLHEAVTWLRDQPGPLVLYHQALGWHYRFYLFDELQPTLQSTAQPPARGTQPPRIDLRWFPSAVYLADNAAKTPFPPRYVVLPDWASQRDLTLHLQMRRLTAQPRMRAGRFTVWQITRPPQPACDWCRSSLPFAIERPWPSGVPAMSREPQP